LIISLDTGTNGSDNHDDGNDDTCHAHGPNRVIECSAIVPAKNVSHGFRFLFANVPVSPKTDRSNDHPSKCECSSTDYDDEVEYDTNHRTEKQ
jgi:hypothetical protein